MLVSLPKRIGYVIDIKYRRRSKTFIVLSADEEETELLVIVVCFSYLYRRNTKGITAKLDDDLLKFYCNEDTFLMQVSLTVYVDPVSAQSCSCQFDFGQHSAHLSKWNFFAIFLINISNISTYSNTDALAIIHIYTDFRKLI